MQINLENLKNGLSTLTSAEGAFLLETALFCLKSNSHNSGISVKPVVGNGEEFTITWLNELDRRAVYSYKDKVEVVEYGATGVAILFALKQTGYNTVERSVRGGGFDYWIGDYYDDNDPPFTKSIRLEISGLFKEPISQIKARFSQKKKQISRSDSIGTPKIVFVIEFSQPAFAAEHTK